MNSANASGRYASISADVIFQHVNVEQDALDGLYRMAEAKLPAGQYITDDRYHGCR
jgi:hypothetical protein